MKYIKHSLSRFILRAGLLSLILAWGSHQEVSGQDRAAYIERFSAIAVSEMHRTGIPASIKLAQGILESNAGSSELAKKANNHFGLKCGSAWKGSKMYRKDDEYNHHGKLVNSCFRTFSSAEESYTAHSEFLTDPAKAYRYGRLFKLSSADYKGWAHGLKRAGYATNPRYAHLLIKIIEDYRLYEYDKMSPESFEEDLIAEEQPVLNDPSAPAAPAVSRILKVQYENDVPFVIARAGDTPSKIGYEMDLPSNRVVQCNEGFNHKHQKLAPGQRVYLKKKKSRYKGSRRYHVVRDGETMQDISDRYAVRLDKLYKRNRLNPGAIPLPGQRIYLQGNNPSSVRTMDSAPATDTRQAMFLWDEAVKPEAQESTESGKVTFREKIQFVSTEPETSDYIEYIVQPKDTLYGIAKLYGTSVDMLKNLNNLDTANIHPGQVLKVQ